MTGCIHTDTTHGPTHKSLSHKHTYTTLANTTIFFSFFFSSDRLSFEEGTTLMVQGLTAHYLVKGSYNIKKGEKKEARRRGGKGKSEKRGDEEKTYIWGGVKKVERRER